MNPRRIALPYFVFVLAASAQTATPPLRQTGTAASMRLGTAVQAAFLTDPTYSSVLAQQYSQIQAEYEMKFDPIESTQNVFNFAPGDTMGSFATLNNMAFRGHTLVWYQAIPAWVTNGGFTPSQLSAILQNHITQVAGHYAGKVYAWDVVNEAFDDNGQGNLRSSLWYDSPGIGFPLGTTGYIEQAFRWARAADPNALLFYNDYSTEDLNAKSDAVYAMVKDFKSRGVPIDGVGFQMHITLGGYPTISGFTQNLQRFTDLGVQVQITEMDVRLLLDSNGNASASDLQSQAAMYQSILNVCLANPSCTAFQTWGFTDLHSWIPGFFPGYGAALPFDQNYVAKPAVSAIEAGLANSPPRFTGAGIVNAASYAGGGVAPGELLAFFGGALGPATLSPLQLDSTGKVSTLNAGVSVTFDGVAAPLVYTLANQLALVAPYEIAGKAGTGTTHVTVNYNNQSTSADVPVIAVQPALLTSDGSGTGVVAAINLIDNTIQSAKNPALHGSYVSLYGTGDGVEKPAYADGALVGSNLPYSSSKVTCTVNGENAPVIYAGGAPGLVAGVLQINMQVPADLAAGSYPVICAISGVSSQGTAVLAVK